ncbi:MULTISPECIES: hypothetical protein [Polymorphospora]|uniref:Uncharacterized protein n=1 Tax=Polymorphospora lycopeni TaxID=3140240 RepID=A0ABV5CYE6_9ACTN
MQPWLPNADDSLLAELGAALRDPGPVPEEFLTAALAAFAWRTVDTDLAIAELTFDSACDPAPAGPVRSAGTARSARTLAFRTGPVSVELEVTGAGIVGQLTPASGGLITARTPDGRYDESPIDQVGFFSLGPPPAGPVQLWARTGGRTLATAWVSLR